MHDDHHHLLPGGLLLPPVLIYSDSSCPEGPLPSSSRATFPDHSSPLERPHPLSPLGLSDHLHLGPGICKLPINHFCLLSPPHPVPGGQGPQRSCSWVPTTGGAQAQQLKWTCALKLHGPEVLLNHHLLACCHLLSIC